MQIEGYHQRAQADVCDMLELRISGEIATSFTRGWGRVGGSDRRLHDF